MIDYIHGTLSEKEPGGVTVEAHGVGYEIIVPLSTYERLGVTGSEVKIHTHFHVREDTQKLYGFMTKQERELFRQLIGVSSIGPRTAIGVLSKMSVNELVRAVTLGDAAAMTKIPGVGAKTAQRLVMELRGKLKISGIPEHTAGAGTVEAGRSIGASEEAFEALVALGYNDKQVARAVERVRQTQGDAAIGVEEWIKRALQVI
jgi:Holliday junction DNA helicase RuvA